jgi:hypothetical protein
LEELPDAETSRRLEALLSDLNETNPQVYDFNFFEHFITWVEWFGQPARSYWDHLLKSYSLTAYALVGAAEERHLIEDIGLRLWVGRFPMWEDPFSKSLTALIPWTDYPSARILVARIAREEPTFMENVAWPRNFSSDLTAEEKLLFAYVGHYPGYVPEHESWHARRAATYARLAQAAYEARAYRLEHGEWPETIQSLGATVAASKIPLPYTPVFFRRLEFDKDRIRDWIRDLMERASDYPASSPELTIRELQRTDETIRAEVHVNSGAEIERLDQFVYWKESLLRKPLGWIKSVELFDAKEGKPLDEDIARRTALSAAARQWSGLEKMQEIGDLRRPDFYPEPATEPQNKWAAVVIKITVEAPRQVFAIWSVGPDGDDDQGRSIGYAQGWEGDYVVYVPEE